MENAALLSGIIENAIDGIITIDEWGVIESINPSACQLFGYLPTNVIGQNITMLMPLPDKEHPDDYSNNYPRDEIARMIGMGREVTGLTKDGTVFPFRLGLSAVKYSGRRIYTGFIHDLSREKEAELKLKEYAADLEQQVQKRTQELSVSLEKEKEVSLLKSRFVSIASHEFRTPLTAIQLSSYLIAKHAEAPANTSQIDKHVGLIQSAVANLTTILNDFLSLEKLESGKELAKYQAINLVDFCEGITEEMQALTKQNQHIIYQHTGLNNLVTLDKGLLKNCIVNLISNAIKYSGEDTFIDFNTEINHEKCIITIRDNGIGIPDADHKHLFEAFFRADNTGSIPGTGLGLNIVARYTNLMNGSIEFSSKVNEGTVFTISFPII
jgi:two-component system sensor kinase FixL